MAKWDIPKKDVYNEMDMVRLLLSMRDHLEKLTLEVNKLTGEDQCSKTQGLTLEERITTLEDNVQTLQTQLAHADFVAQRHINSLGQRMWAVENDTKQILKAAEKGNAPAEKPKRFVVERNGNRYTVFDKSVYGRIASDWYDTLAEAERAADLLNDGWTLHNGKDFPKYQPGKVDVMWRNGSTPKFANMGHAQYWIHAQTPSSSDIIAYRMVEEAKPASKGPGISVGISADTPT